MVKLVPVSQFPSQVQAAAAPLGLGQKQQNEIKKDWWRGRERVHDNREGTKERVRKRVVETGCGGECEGGRHHVEERRGRGALGVLCVQCQWAAMRDRRGFTKDRTVTIRGSPQ